MNFDNDDLEAFLVEAELVNQKVKALAENKLSPEQFDRLQAVRAEDKRKREEAKQRNINEKLIEQINGREGKGITKDFSNFCRFCHRQYELATPVCLKCKRPTMTLEQRQKQLQVMVADYKQAKLKRENKKQKWEMWQKTQAMVWKKNSVNYNKWEYFLSDSEEEVEKEPILPKNDPNFKALEIDLQERKKKRVNDADKAKKLKEKGNAAMKDGDYQKAMEMYTLALEHVKDMKSIYTNRALAFLKLKKYKKAIQDCTNVIEFMEVFQKAGENKDLAFKAFSRRAMAQKELKQYKEALKDIDQALKMIPNDKTAILLKKEIEGFVEHTSKVEQLLRENNLNTESKRDKQSTKKEEQAGEEESDLQNDKQKQRQSKRIQRNIAKELAEKDPLEFTSHSAQKQQIPASVTISSLNKISPIDQVKQLLETINEQNLKKILNLLIVNKDLREIFISAKGIESCLNSLLQTERAHYEAQLICFCLDRDGVAEKRVWDYGIVKLQTKISQCLADETHLNFEKYSILEDIFEILISISLYEPHRMLLSSSASTWQFIEAVYSRLLSKHKKQTCLLEKFIIYLGNLVSGESVLKNIVIDHSKCRLFFESLFVIVFDHQTKNRNYLQLKKSCYSFISNMLTSLNHRKTFIDFASAANRFEDVRIQLAEYPRVAHNFDEYVETILAMLVNLSLDTHLRLDELANTIFNRFVVGFRNFSKEIVYRSLLVLARLEHKTMTNAVKWMQTFAEISLTETPLKNPDNKSNMVQIVKLTNIFAGISPSELKQISEPLLQALFGFVADNICHEVLFCNSCNFFGVLLQSESALRPRILLKMKESMKRLVEIAKQRTGNWRKNAAILIAKCSSDVDCRSQMDRYHGMDVLKSIASFVVDSK